MVICIPILIQKPKGKKRRKIIREQNGENKCNPKRLHSIYQQAQRLMKDQWSLLLFGFLPKSFLSKTQQIYSNTHSLSHMMIFFMIIEANFPFLRKFYRASIVNTKFFLSPSHVNLKSSTEHQQIKSLFAFVFSQYNKITGRKKKEYKYEPKLLQAFDNLLEIKLRV